MKAELLLALPLPLSILRALLWPALFAMRLVLQALLGACLLMLSVTTEALPLSDNQQIAAARQVYGPAGAKRTQAWRLLVSQMQAAPLTERETLLRVNHFFNHLRFIDDMTLWGQADYWATPLEFLGVGGGDCEDFSVAKYQTLRELGIADDKLRLVYVKALSLNQFHMVVAYYPTPAAVPYILDNLQGSIRLADDRADLAPIYSFNGQHLWLMQARGAGRLAGPASRLSLWNELKGRIENDQLRTPHMALDD